MNSIFHFSDLESQAAARGLNLCDVAQMSGIALSTLYRWKNGAHDPSIKTLRKIHNACFSGDTSTEATR